MPLLFPHPKNKERLVDLFTIISEKEDMIPIEETNEETGNVEVKGHIISRRGILRLIDEFDIHISHSAITELPNGLILMGAKIGSTYSVSGVWGQNLKGLGRKFPIETLQYRAEARVVIRYLKLYRYKIYSEDESAEFKEKMGEKMEEKKETPKKKKGRSPKYVCANCNKKISAEQFRTTFESSKKGLCPDCGQNEIKEQYK